MGRTAHPSRPGSGPGRRERGFTFFGLLIAMALIGIALAAIGTVVKTDVRRQKEAQLLFVGHEFRTAIGRYTTANGGVYPQSLADLLKDESSVKPAHYLRRLYPDPMTGGNDWVLMRQPDGGIYGIYSSSMDVPLKQARFGLRDRGFDDAKCYRAWRFTYVAFSRRLFIQPPPVDCPTASQQAQK